MIRCVFPLLFLAGCGLFEADDGPSDQFEPDVDTDADADSDTDSDADADADTDADTDDTDADSGDTDRGPRVLVMREQWENPPQPPRIYPRFWERS